MKLLITEPTNNILFGLYEAAKKQHDIIILQTGISIYQILDTIKIDCFICETQQLTQSMINALNEYNIPTIVVGLGIDFPQKKLTVLYKAIHPDLLKNHNGPIYQLIPATHMATYPEIIPFDILYIAEGNNDIPILQEVLKKIYEQGYTIKIIGPASLLFPEYVGNATYNEIVGLINVATITILTTPTYLYDVAYRQKFAITTFKNDLFTASIDEITHFMIEEKHRISAAKKACKSISDNDTYKTRFNEIMEKALCK